MRRGDASRHLRRLSTREAELSAWQGEHMATMYYDNDADLTHIRARRVAIIGYGSQGHAHASTCGTAASMWSSGCTPAAGPRERARREDLHVTTVASGRGMGRFVMLLVPDTRQAEIYADAIAPHLTPGQDADVRAWLRDRFGTIIPPSAVDVAMVAPKAPGSSRARGVRRRRRARQGCWPFIRTQPDGQGDSRWPTRRRSAAHAPASSRRHSPRKRRPTCSASRQCCAAA